MIKRKKVVKEVVKKVAKKSPRTNLERTRAVLDGMGGDSEFWNPKEGRNKIRILPSGQEDGSFFYKSTLHYGFTAGGTRRAYPCYSAVDKPRCPVCRVIALHEDDSSPDIQKAIHNLMPKNRFLMNVVVRPSEEVKIFGAPWTVMKKLRGIVRDDDYGDITDPDEGHDVTVIKEGTGLNTEYDVTPSPKVTRVGVEDWESALHDLKKKAYREIPSRQEYINYLMDCYGDLLDIRSIFRDETKGVKKKKLIEEEDEDEEEEEEEEEEEDEEEDLEEEEDEDD